MTFKTLLASAVVSIAMAASASAATLTATFDDTPLRGSSTAAPNDIVSLSISDKVGGGVSLTFEGLLSSEGGGSFYVQGFDAAQFTGPTNIFDPTSANAYSEEISPDGVVFTTDGLSVFLGDSLTFMSVATSLTTADFSGVTVGFISTTDIAPNSLQSLYRGEMSTVTTAPVPLPAGLPLMLLGLGALGIARQRIKHAA
ncbi:VPLPA-CTERM sorting domain-containing protein [Primorskyibacter sp. S187A]|uniref:VPLPA-CTERM sorting domain-containing protein n=1 Tax=Primorskyibacter sp. S187A TaxID=3415130 RepID=UPI003C7CDBB9